MSSQSQSPSRSATTVGSPSVAATAAASSTSALAAFYGQHLQWTSCSDGFRCSTLRVPLDYSRPAGATIGVAVIDLPATSKQRIGAVVLNPGGPGASGVDYERAVAVIIRDRLGGRFDVVSFDPRGVGESDPVRCATSAQLDAYNAFFADPADAAQVAQEGLLAHQFAAGCQARSGALLPYVGTANTARDLDLLRAALGDQRLTYIGASYGTYLGAVYAGLFPTHVRALVLDGALDPSVSATEEDTAQAAGFETALASFDSWCAARSGCPLGRVASAAEGKLDALLAHLSTAPVKVTSSRSLTEGLALTGVAAALYSPSSWTTLSSALTAALAGRGSALLALADELNGRSSNGSYDNLVEANVAINCADRPSPAGGIEADAAAALAGATAAPTFGEYIGWGTPPCAYWPQSAPAPAPISADGSPPILVIGTLRDPATPYRWAQALAGQLANARLLTYDGDGHTGYLRGSSCVDSAVDAYLTALTLPASGLVCHPG